MATLEYTPLDVYLVTEQKIYEALDTGELNNEEAEEVLTEAIVELADAYQITPEQALDELESLEQEIEEYDEEDEEAYYSHYNNRAEFNQGLTFGNVLAELAANQYGDLETAVEEIAYSTGQDIDDIIDILEGQALPDADLTEQLADVLDATANDEVYVGFLRLAANERDEELEDIYDLEEDEEEYVDEDVTEAQLAAAYAAEVDNKLTNFQQEQAITKTLNQLITKANYLLENGAMYPVEYEILFSQVDSSTGESVDIADFSEEDKLNAFVDLSIANGFSDATDQFKAIDLFLSVCEKRGAILPMGKFSSEVEKENKLANFNQNEKEFYNAQAKTILKNLNI